MKISIKGLITVLIILALITINTQPFQKEDIIDSDFIEREEDPKEHEDNYLEIYTHNGNPFIKFNGFHERGIIYLGDFKDISDMYGDITLDFVLVKSNETRTAEPNIYIINENKEIPLIDEDNTLKILGEETILLMLKRFKFTISTNLTINDELLMEDSQFFVLTNLSQLEEVKESFSIEQIFLIGDEYPPNDDPIITVIPSNYYIRFVSNFSSYNFDYKKLD